MKQEDESSAAGVASNLSYTGLGDVAAARENAIAKFKEINWSEYTRTAAFNLKQADVEVFRDGEAVLDGGNDKFILSFMKDHGKQFCLGLVNLLRKITEPTVVRYALARIEELLSEPAKLRERVQLFMENGVIDSGPFLRLVRSGQGYAQHAAATNLATLLSVKPQNQDIEALLDWVVSSLDLGRGIASVLNEPATAGSARAAVTALMILLRLDEARLLFVKANGIKLVSDLIKYSEGRTQLLYELCFCLWTLTFCEEAIPHFDKVDAIRTLCNQVAAAPREKVVRVAIAALRNLTGKMNYNQAMIDAALLKTLGRLKDKKWADSDIADDMELISQRLHRDYKELSSVERYAKEVMSGKLEWSLLHTEKFWRENVMEFEKRDFELIKILINHLKSDNPLTVQVALYDIGEFVRFYPNGRSIAKTLGARDLVMALLADQDPGIQKQALATISKMMVHNWEFVR